MCCASVPCGMLCASMCCVMHFEKSEQGWMCAMTDMFRVDLSGRQVLTLLSLGLAHGFGNTSQGILVERECSKRCELVSREVQFARADICHVLFMKCHGLRLLNA